MPFQAIAWAWNVPVTTAQERLALIWLSNKADAANGLAYDFDIDAMADFVCVSRAEASRLLEELKHLGALEGFIRGRHRASAILKFPVMDWDQEGPIVNREPLPVALRREVVNGAGCFACGSRDSVQADHIFPRARGGTNDRTNLQPLCAECNRQKRHHTGWVGL